MAPSAVGDDLSSILESQYYTQLHLVALGRVVELSALLESLLRQVLAELMGISGDAGEALFLGDRAGALVRRFGALAEFKGLPGWLPDAVAWAKQAGKAVDDRDALVHRAPTYIVKGDNNDGRVGWAPARRGQKPEYFDDRVLDLVRRLTALNGQAMKEMAWGTWVNLKDKPEES